MLWVIFRMELEGYFVCLFSVFTPQDSVNWEENGVEVYQWYCQEYARQSRQHLLAAWRPFTLYRTLATRHTFIEIVAQKSVLHWSPHFESRHLTLTSIEFNLCSSTDINVFKNCSLLTLYIFFSEKKLAENKRVLFSWDFSPVS